MQSVFHVPDSYLAKVRTQFTATRYTSRSWRPPRRLSCTLFRLRPRQPHPATFQIPPVAFDIRLRRLPRSFFHQYDRSTFFLFWAAPPRAPRADLPHRPASMYLNVVAVLPRRRYTVCASIYIAPLDYAARAIINRTYTYGWGGGGGFAASVPRFKLAFAHPLACALHRANAIMLRVSRQSTSPLRTRGSQKSRYLTYNKLHARVHLTRRNLHTRRGFAIIPVTSHRCVGCTRRSCRFLGYHAAARSERGV